MAQRTLSRTIPALLPTPRTNEATGVFPHERPESMDNLATRISRLPDEDAEVEEEEEEEVVEDGVRLLPTPSAWLGRRPENATADPERMASREHEGTRGKRSLELPEALALAGVTEKLLPTPTAGDAKAAGSRNLEGSSAHAGVSLTDAIQTGNSTTPRLLPTPQAADGDGGRQEKGAMAAGGVRPSGHKATLPLPTAVAMRDEISDRPFAAVEPGEQASLFEVVEVEVAACGCLLEYVDAGGYCACCGAHHDDPDGMYALQRSDRHGLRRCPLHGLPVAIDVLLPTPVANAENPGAGGELRAAIVHGEGRRNETGVDSLGRPNHGRRAEPLLPTPNASDGDKGGPNRRDGAGHPYLSGVDILFPTPTTQDANNTGGESQRARHTDPLNVVASDLAEPQLLPTPRVTSERNSRHAMVENQQWSSVSLAQAAEIARGILPREFHSWDEVPGELGRDARARIAARQLLPTPQAADGERSSEQMPRYYAGGGDNPTLLGAARRSEISWGVYEAAIRRWEMLFGREAPPPTDEKGRLDPAFVEWMLGYPEGWFELPGLKRTAKLRALGNSVQVQCGEVVGAWARELVLSGALFAQ